MKNELTRHERIEAVINGKEPDRVPFCLHANNFYSIEYGLTMYDVMKDARNFRPALLQFVKDFEPDLVGMPTTYPLDAFKICDYQSVRYPGPDMGLPLDTPFQYIDTQYMGDDDYEVYLKDPSGYLFRNVFTKQYKAFESLGNLSVNGFCTASIYGMAAFAAPPIKEALMNMIKAGEVCAEYLGNMGAMAAELEGMGYPTFGLAGALNPFDALGDNIRGIMDANMDLLDCPEDAVEFMERWSESSLPGHLFAAKSSGSKYVFMPLHSGGEMFMSVDTFGEYYWPYVKRYMEAFIAEGIRPIVFCEGAFTSRLELLADITPGNVIYIFEDVDLAKAKKVLGGIATIMGGMKTQTLMFGSVEDVVEETKQILDICAPGGGFIMSNSIALDQAKRENVEAWRKAVSDFGTYC